MFFNKKVSEGRKHDDMLVMEENKSHNIIKLLIPAKEENISIVRLCVSGVGAQMKFTVDEIEDIKIAVGEATINAIFHGYNKNNAPENIVSLQFETYPSKLAITVQDTGKGFDIKQIKNHTQQSKKKEFEENGLGIFLIKSLMDEVEFFSNSTGTQVKMVKHRRDLT